MKKVIAVLLMVAGIIHLIPVTGVLGAERLAALYGLEFTEPDLVILMRHRAVLFGLLGLFLVYSAFRPKWQPIAFAAGIVSAMSFIVIAWQTGGYNSAIGKVVTADWVAVASLLVAMLLYFLSRRH